MGALDTNGVYQYAETDPASPFSDLLNLLAGSVSDRIGDLDTELSGLAALLSGRVMPYRVAAGRTTMASAAWTQVNFPAGRFTVAPLVIGSPTAQGAYTFAKNVPTTTGFQGGVLITNTGALIAAQFDWIAIQMTSAAAAG